MAHNPECGLDCVSAGAVRLDNKAKHTPGPWAANVDQVYSNANVLGNIVCFPPPEYMESNKHWEANARLIAAAPEMLEALKDAHRVLTSAGMSDAIDLDYIAEVIAKAEGRDR